MDYIILRMVGVLASFGAGLWVATDIVSASPIVRGTYYEDNAVAFSQNTTCVISFSKSPAAKSILITHLSCRIEVSVTDLQFAFLTAAGSSTRAEFLSVLPTKTAGGFHAY